MSVNSLGFLLASNIPDLELKKKMAMDADKQKSPNKSLLPLAKVSRKGKLSKAKHF